MSSLLVSTQIFRYFLEDSFSIFDDLRNGQNSSIIVIDIELRHKTKFSADFQLSHLFVEDPIFSSEFVQHFLKIRVEPVARRFFLSDELVASRFVDQRKLERRVRFSERRCLKEKNKSNFVLIVDSPTSLFLIKFSVTRSMRRFVEFFF